MEYIDYMYFVKNADLQKAGGKIDVKTKILFNIFEQNM
jgi:hypothetical protein